MVSPHNPLKNSDDLQNEQQRLDWTRRAVRDYPKFKVIDIEFSLPKPSYSIQTLQALREQFPQKEFTLIIGADNWDCFDKWRNYKTILAEFPIVIYPRRGFEVIIPDELASTVKLTNAPMLEISSTFIRESIAAGKDISFFLPEGIRNSFFQ